MIESQGATAPRQCDQFLISDFQANFYFSNWYREQFTNYLTNYDSNTWWHVVHGTVVCLRVDI